MPLLLLPLPLLLPMLRRLHVAILPLQFPVLDHLLIHPLPPGRPRAGEKETAIARAIIKAKKQLFVTVFVPH